MVYSLKSDKKNNCCPRCGYKEIRRSRRRDFRESFIGLFGITPYRCKECYERFLVRTSPMIALQGRTWLFIAAAVIALFVFLALPRSPADRPDAADNASIQTEEKSQSRKDISEPESPLPVEELQAAKVGQEEEPEPATVPLLIETQDQQQSPDLEAVDRFVQSWAEAWERKDIAGYLDHYSGEFKPPGNISLEDWHEQRQKNLLRPAFIKIEINNMQKEITGPARVRLTFNQKYLSDVYADQVIKTLDLQREGAGWKIMEETSKAE